MTQTARGTPVDGCVALVVAEGRRWLRVVWGCSPNC